MSAEGRGGGTGRGGGGGEQHEVQERSVPNSLFGCLFWFYLFRFVSMCSVSFRGNRSVDSEGIGEGLSIAAIEPPSALAATDKKGGGGHTLTEDVQHTDEGQAFSSLAQRLIDDSHDPQKQRLVYGSK